MNITYNTEKNGIEIRFECKPSREVLDNLKENGFRWSNKQKIWFAKKTDERTAFVSRMAGGSEIKAVKANPTKTTQNGYDLWDLTFVSGELDNVDENLSTKEIAAKIRQHIKTRFPMCKFSVTCSGRDSIHITMKSSPFEKGSEALNAIVEYVCRYTNSYRYCTCYDPYGDYGSSYNFYGVYSNSILSYEYNRTQPTVEDFKAIDSFNEKKAAHEAAERAREEIEMQERMKEMEKEREEMRRLNEIRKSNAAIIEKNAEVSNASYYAVNCYTLNANKQDRISDYFEFEEDEDQNIRRETCLVSREVRFDGKTYELFANQLMDDYTFLEGMGGSRTDDLRISDMQDYNCMPRAERDTVAWYNIECVAILVGDEIKCIIDPQGYNYARYVYFVDDMTEIKEEHSTEQILSMEEYNENCKKAESLEDMSAEVIINNGLRNAWFSDEFEQYKNLLIDSMNRNGFKLDIGVVRAIQDNNDFKTAMYKVLTEINGIQYQFAHAGFEYGQKITVIKISEFGGITARKLVYKSMTSGDYASRKGVYLRYAKDGRPKYEYGEWLYSDVIVYDGFVDIPESLLWDITVSGSMVCKKSKYLSFDNEQYNVILDYFKEKGMYPVVNTYNPNYK